MPIAFIKQKKKQKYMLLIAGAVIIITGVVLWFGYFRKPKTVVIETEPASFVQEIKIDFKVFENPFLKQSQPFEKTPIFEGEKGRNNPFIPY